MLCMMLGTIIIANCLVILDMLHCKNELSILTVTCFEFQYAATSSNKDIIFANEITKVC